MKKIIFILAMALTFVSCQKEEMKTPRFQSEQREINEAEFISKESVGFFKLVAKLKATNGQSEERQKIVEKLNTQYGTTLKNLEDEKRLTQDIALAVYDFIKQQKLRFRLQKNEAYIQYTIAKQCETENKLKKATALLTKDLLINEQGLYTYKSGEVIGTLDDVAGRFNVQGEGVRKLIKQNDKYKKKLEDLAGTYVYLSGEANKYNKTVEDTTETTTTTTSTPKAKSDPKVVK